jgi:arsenate reductase
MILLRLCLLCTLMFVAKGSGQSNDSKPGAGSAVATALAFSHLYAKPASLTPDQDRALKAKLIGALSKSPQIKINDVGNFFDTAALQRFSAGKESLSLQELERLVEEKTPRSRRDMSPKLKAHADLLATQFDMIEERHRKSADSLVAWLVKNYQAGQPVHIIVICTGNTRRSMLGATMGNVAAAYCGLPNVRFHSGGTEPEAINPRTIATLKEIGIKFEPTGKEAEHGKKGLENPIYRVVWGNHLETTEFSKRYTDPANPQSNFAAILVCSEAEDACPRVAGASARIPLLYLDPKAFDGALFESAKYAERRDDIGRMMINIMTQVRRQLEVNGKLN